MSDLPVWLGKARRIRGAVLVVLLAVIFLAFHARLGMAGESALRPALPFTRRPPDLAPGSGCWRSLR